MSFTIEGAPRGTTNSTSKEFGDSFWLESTLESWESLFASMERHPQLNLGNLAFVTLYDWTTTVCLIEKSLSTIPSVEYFGICLLNSDEYEILPPNEYKKIRKSPKRDQHRLFKLSDRAYQLVGFIESLGTLTVLNQRPGGVVGYPLLGAEYAAFRSNYTRQDGTETVNMPLLKIEAKRDINAIPDSEQFLDPHRIASWKEAMSDRYRDSPIFRYEELWRVFCYELTQSIHEHARCSGYITCRVVEPTSATGEILNWVGRSYPASMQQTICSARDGFIELCVCDAGDGLTCTLAAAYRERANIPEDETVDGKKILAFAFDEIGTSKPTDGCWATERHALGRILLIVTKYGGVLRVRSQTSEVTYISDGSAFEREPNHLGFKPTAERDLPHPVSGTHFQLILPLYPKESAGQPLYKDIHSTLPRGFQHDTAHVTGHIVPLREWLSPAADAIKSSNDRAVFPGDEPKQFIAACERLVRRIINERPAAEPLILDFSDLNWHYSKFETLLNCFQNILLARPAILVELDPNLAREVIKLTDISSLLPTSKGTILETYHAIHIHILGVDRDGTRYIFGVTKPYRDLLLTICKAPMSKAAMLKRREIDPQVLTSILNNVNPLFTKLVDPKTKIVKWSTVWNDNQIDRESRRAMTRHFDEIATICVAWRGRVGKESTFCFNMPWSNKWMTEFFESSRIIARQRYADEVAQRLVFRLESGLAQMGRSITDIKVLACATAPSNLLAYAIYRWWPTERPAIADMGPYLMLNPGGELPSLKTDGAYVIIQDVLDTGIVSRGLIKLLHEQRKEIVCLMALVQLVPEGEVTGYTSPIDRWLPHMDCEGVLHHAMVKLKRPVEYDIKTDSRPRQHWIEPRTLRPFSYSLMRREAPEKERRIKRTRATFFNPPTNDIVRSGHYVYGDRHYPVALDMEKAFQGIIGCEVQDWIARICLDNKFSQSSWETDRGYGLEGEVTVILMPLHSRIHYLWPKIEELLAQRGRRVVCHYLDATLFMGYGPAYRLPFQLDDLIRKAANRILSCLLSPESERSNAEKAYRDLQLRVLILDDAIVRARTAETILAEISRVVDKAREDLLEKFAPNPVSESQQRIEEMIFTVQPIAWIRYFVLFSQLGHARHTHWNELTSVGSQPGIPFVFESHSWIVGMPGYGETDCPTCNRRRRLCSLAESNRVSEIGDVCSWASTESIMLHPTALDAPPGDMKPVCLSTAGLPATEERTSGTVNITILAKVGSGSNSAFLVKNVDLAVLRFFEVAYLSYPPRDFLDALRHNMPSPVCTASIKSSLEKYRWCVLEWSINNWPRLVADSAREVFIEQIEREIAIASPLVARALEGVACLNADFVIAEFIWKALTQLADLEIERSASSGPACGESPANPSSAVRMVLFGSLAIYLNSIADHAISHFPLHGKHVDLRVLLARLAVKLNSDPKLSNQILFVGLLDLMVASPRGTPQPSFVLRILCEILFRGRDSSDPLQGAHRMMPFYLYKIARSGISNEEGMILRSALGQFIGAIRGLGLFDHSQDLNPISKLSEEVVEWLSNDDSERAIRNKECPTCVSRLSDILDPDKSFCSGLDQRFRERIAIVKTTIDRQFFDCCNTKSGKHNFEFDFVPDAEVEDWRVLTHIKTLIDYICNLTFANSDSLTCDAKARVSVHRHKEPHGTDSLRFHILSSIASSTDSMERILHGRHHDSEAIILKGYGVRLTDEWCDPDPVQIRDGFSSCNDFYVPVGYIPKSIH